MKKDFAALCCLTFTVLVLALTTPAAAQNVKIKMGAASSPPILDTITPSRRAFSRNTAWM
jgi:hypothetical protein